MAPGRVESRQLSKRAQRLFGGADWLAPPRESGVDPFSLSPSFSPVFPSFSNPPPSIPSIRHPTFPLHSFHLLQQASASLFQLYAVRSILSFNLPRRVLSVLRTASDSTSPFLPTPNLRQTNLRLRPRPFQPFDSLSFSFPRYPPTLFWNLTVSINYRSSPPSR